MQDRANTTDTKIQALLEVDEGGVIPDLAFQFFSRYQFAGLDGQHGKNLGGLGLEAESFTALA
jgi:hypothetical protein